MSKITSMPNQLVEETKRFEKTRKISLTGTEVSKPVILVENDITTWQITKEYDQTKNEYQIVSKKAVDKTSKTVQSPLKAVSADELDKLRRKNSPALVIKIEGELFYSEIPYNTNFVSCQILGEHKCAGIANNSVCNRLSPATDEEGGCQKVRDDKTRRIEDYPWIISGYQSVNTKDDIFVVVKCSHYEECPPRHQSDKRNKAN